MQHLFWVSLLLYCGLLSGAGPVTHARLADLYLETMCYSASEQEAFRLGTLFPDIRYICSIKREETHEKDVSLPLIRRTDDPFIAGMRFHSWVDEKREAFVKSYGIYRLFHSRPFLTGYLKFIEDQILFNHYNWRQWRHVVRLYHPHEKMKCDPRTLFRWHMMLGVAFSLEPEVMITLHYHSGKKFLNLTNWELGSWQKYFHADVSNPIAHQYVSDLTNHFSSLLDGSP